MAAQEGSGKAKPPGARSGKNARSGPTTPEELRRVGQKKLRWSAEQATRLAQLAARWGVSESEAAARAVDEALARG